VIDPVELAGWSMLVFVSVFLSSRWLFRRVPIDVEATANRVLDGFGELNHRIARLEVRFDKLDREVGRHATQLDDLNDTRSS